MAFDDYLEWAKRQECTDCGAKASERVDPWVTETQCWGCYRKYGPPEARGKAGAKEAAMRDGVKI